MTEARLRNATFIALFAGVAGLFLTTLVLRLLNGDPTSPELAIGTTAPAINYNTYTFVLIDNYTSETSLVEGVWLAWVPDDGSPIQLVGLPRAPYQDLFSPGLNGVPLVSIQKHIRGQPLGSIVLEHNDILDLANELGGLMLEGDMCWGEAVLDYYLNPSLDPDTALRNQGAVMQAIVSRIAEKGSQINLDSLLRLPVASSVSTDQLAFVAARYYPLSTENVVVHPLLDGGE